MISSGCGVMEICSFRKNFEKWRSYVNTVFINMCGTTWGLFLCGRDKTVFGPIAAVQSQQIT